jgi:hypothetical protein
MSIRLTAGSLAGLATVGGLAAFMLAAAPAPALAQRTWSTSCVFIYGSISCTSTRRRGPVNPHIVTAPDVLSDKERAEIERRDKQWEARCRPELRRDEFGVQRYVYAAPGCEFGRLE